MRKQAAKKLCKRQQGIYHRLIRRTTDDYVGLTDDTESAAKKNSHRLNRCPGLNSVDSTGDRAPDDPTKSNTNVGAVVQRDSKTDKPSTGWTDVHNHKAPVQLSKESAKPITQSTG